MIDEVNSVVVVLFLFGKKKVQNMVKRLAVSQVTKAGEKS
jgi:hypothetical protein